MANPTITSILSTAAGFLGDPTQEQFTQAILLPFYSIAYREAWDLAARWGLPKAQRDAYALLPAYQEVLIPSAGGITDVGQPISVWERPASTTVAIASCSSGTPISVTTSAPHGLSSNQLVDLYGVVGIVGINDQWRITVTDSTHFTLNGSVAGGTYTSGGTVIVGGEESTNPFRQMAPVETIPQSPLDQYLRVWKWQDDAYHFKGATTAIELWIEYEASGAPPQSGSVGWDNSANFLAERTASLAAIPYDMPGSHQLYTNLALGASGQPDGSGGSLRGFLYPALREKQKRPARAKPFRQRRNALGRSLW